MNVTIKLRLGYKDLFNDEPKSKEYYIERIDKDVIPVLICTLISAADPQFPFNKPKIFFSKFYPENKDILAEKINEIEYEIDNEAGLFDIACCLKVVESILSNQIQQLNGVTEMEMKICLLKLILITNDEQIENEKMNDENNASEYNSNKTENIFLNQKYNNFDLSVQSYPDLIIAQFIKSIEFFKYIEKNPKLINYMHFFNNKYSLENWEEWVQNLFRISGIIITSHKEHLASRSYYEFKLDENDDYTKSCIFFDSLSINIHPPFLDKKFEKDFISLRTYPVYRVREGEYLIISLQFLFEKIFKSVQFTFSKEIHNKLPKEKRIKNFKAVHCDNFSEQTLLYNILHKSFPKKWIKIAGEDFKKAGYDGEPDFYVRFKNKIFIFESKDVFLRGEVKQSFDIKFLKKELKKKFYKIEHPNNKIEKKAVLQLLENIKRISNKYYEKCDGDYNQENIIIYPILITHDRQFDCLCVNKLINRWFNEELNNSKLEFKCKTVSPLTLINIDTFLLYYKALQQRSVKLEQMIKSYFDIVYYDKSKCRTFNEIKEKEFKSYVSFQDFFMDTMDSKSIKKTNIKEVKQYVFPDLTD